MPLGWQPTHDSLPVAMTPHHEDRDGRPQGAIYRRNTAVDVVVLLLPLTVLQLAMVPVSADYIVPITITRYSSTDRCVPPSGGCKVSVIGQPNSASCTIQVPPYSPGPVYAPFTLAQTRPRARAPVRRCGRSAVDEGEARCLTASDARVVRRNGTWT